MSEDDFHDLAAPCFICGREHLTTRMVQTRRAPDLFVHIGCLCPTKTVSAELTLSDDLIRFLLQWSAETNLSVNNLIEKALRAMLLKAEQKKPE